MLMVFLELLVGFDQARSSHGEENRERNEAPAEIDHRTNSIPIRLWMQEPSSGNGLASRPNKGFYPQSISSNRRSPDGNSGWLFARLQRHPGLIEVTAAATRRRIGNEHQPSRRNRIDPAAQSDAAVVDGPLGMG